MAGAQWSPRSPCAGFGPGKGAWARSLWVGNRGMDPRSSALCTYVCKHSHVCTCTHMCTQMRVPADMHTRIHTCTQTSKHTVTCTRIRARLRSLAHAFTSTRVHTCGCARMCAHPGTDMHTHTYVDVHTLPYAALLVPHSSPPRVCTHKPTHSPTTSLQKPALPKSVAPLTPCTPAMSQNAPEKQRRVWRVTPERSMDWFSQAGDPPAPPGFLPPSLPSWLMSLRLQERSAGGLWGRGPLPPVSFPLSSYA